jgi:hypothetical protein
MMALTSQQMAERKAKAMTALNLPHWLLRRLTLPQLKI